MTYKRKEVIGDATLYLGDCLDILGDMELAWAEWPDKIDAMITDPPYGVTSCSWDDPCCSFEDLVPTSVMWVFGSMRSILESNITKQVAGYRIKPKGSQSFTPIFTTDDAWAQEAKDHGWELETLYRENTPRGFACRGWKFAQDIVWEKHNGSNFHNDRFRRVHEHALMFYRGEWGDIYKNVQFTNDAKKRTVRRKQKPGHMGDIKESSYVSEDGGPRMASSVIKCRSCHGYAQHPTQKPVGIIEPIVRYSIPEGGVVIDPFMGSGTTGVACANLGRKFIGIEIEEKYFDIACERIDAAYRQGRLFE